MKRTTLFTTMIAAGMAFFLAGTAEAGRRGGGNQQVASISAEDAEHLTFLREEEKLARDVYQAMFDLWQVNIFANIASSEQRHMDAILNLLDKYGLPDPALGEGEFQNAELQELYDNLIATGSKSLLDALLVGGLIEEVDIEDLVVAIAATSKSDLINVYSNLLSGSEQHLRAFASNIEAITGEPYEAQYISDEEVAVILAAPSKGRRGRR